MTEMSQDDIDSMLGGGGGGTSTAEKPKATELSGKSEPLSDDAKTFVEYDFKNPIRFLREQTNTLHLIHDTFTQMATLGLTAYLSSDIDIKLDRVEQRSFYDYITTLPVPTCIVTFDMLPLNGYALIQVNSGVLYPVIDKMLGGDGEQSIPERAFTDLEISIVRKLFDLMLKELKGSWAYVMDLNMSIKDVQTNPSFVRVVSMRELCIIVTMHIRVEEAKGQMTICIPYVNLEPVASKLGNEQMASRHSAKQSKELEEMLKASFNEVSLDVSGVLGTMELSMVELLGLQKGDILDIGKRTREPVDVLVAGTRKFQGSSGLVGKYKGILIQNKVVDG